MELNDLKDLIFDLLNEIAEVDFLDIEMNDQANTLTVLMLGGNTIKVTCSAVS